MALTIVIGNRNDSSWSLRGWLALQMSGAAFDEILVPLGRPDSRERILRHSPTGKVPLLKSEDGDIWDSLAIAEYLAERFPEAHLWPRGEAARAMARALRGNAQWLHGLARRVADGPAPPAAIGGIVRGDATGYSAYLPGVGGVPPALRPGRCVPARPCQPRGCVLRAGGGALPQLCRGVAGHRPGLCRDHLSVACVSYLVRRGIARAGLVDRRYRPRRCAAAVARR